MPIKILPPQLANQIAAGEVVERPASVIKELVENSLDANATKIDVEIDKGGHKRMLVRDNGDGISKEQLALALSRHATSKIDSLSDLERIHSLGFRGEALASISSVARLSLTSKPEQQEQAWQAQAEGRDMQVSLNPAAHPKGSSVEVLDLFFNTPARRKFLRAEKTEFQHIDEVIKRIALSRCDVAFSLKHNGKQVRQLPAIREGQDPFKRVAKLMHSSFANRAVEVQSEYEDMQLRGWMASPEALRTQADSQYVYVNGRMMKDKLINHAIRQAYTEQGVDEGYPQFVLFLSLPPGQFDVNVHPAKHEVRFHQSRLVHDFIYRATADLLAQQSHSPHNPIHTTEPKHQYIQPLQQSQGIRESATGYAASVGQFQQGRSVSKPVDTQQQWVVGNLPDEHKSVAAENLLVGQYLLLDQQRLLIIRKNQLVTLDYSAILAFKFAQQSEYVGQPLLMPISIEADKALIVRAGACAENLRSIGLDIGVTERKCLLRKVPAGLREIPWGNLLHPLITAEGCSDSISFKLHLVGLIARANFACSAASQHNLVHFLQRLERPQFDACLSQYAQQVSVS